jgi:uncharacterized protein (DUF1778 family)
MPMSVKPKKFKYAKSKTLNLRVTEAEKSAFEEAASIKQVKVSNFILSHAYEIAQQVIRNQYIMAVSKDQWQDICYALDHPPKNNPALRKLMKAKSIFAED